jgi:hypothetical protein
MLPPVKHVFAEHQTCLLMPAEALAVQGFAQLAGQRLLQPESQELPL